MPVWVEIVLADAKANRGSPKGLFIVLFYRAARAVRMLPFPLWCLGAPLLAAYILIVDWFMGVELGYQVDAGRGLAIHHGHGLVVNNEVKIGSVCVLRQGVTIGNRHPGGPSPVLGNNVDVGAHAIILGGITLGNGCRIGAGAVVLCDVPPGQTAVGNPARVVEGCSYPELAPCG